jgi:probable F420-dependent oxidoreductase
VNLGRIGIWSRQLRSSQQTEQVVEASRELEQLGYGTLWIPDSGPDILDRARVILSATDCVVVATGILSIWVKPAAETAAEHHAVTRGFSGRFLLGLGVSHAPIVDRVNPGRYRRPVEAMISFLDQLDRAPDPVPSSERVLAALGPRMLALARDRTAGAHPYLAPASHTRRAREILGPGPLLAPEQAVVLETDPEHARQIARRFLSVYLRLPNYLNSLRREGFADDDFANGGSDRLVDAIVPWGDASAAAGRITAHLDAGADHVCVQVLTSDREALPMEEWRQLAAELPM